MDGTIMKENDGSVGGPSLAVIARGLTKTYGTGENAVTALDHVDLEINEAEMTAIVGASGSGKSTLLHVVSGLDNPTEGDSWVDGVHVQKLSGSSRKRAQFRRAAMGFVFQQHGLVPVLTVRENILLPESLDGKTPDPEDFRRVIESLGLTDRLDHLPDQLSGGQRQKTAIARVILQRSKVVFADEPTGSLDVDSSKMVLDLFRRVMVNELGLTVVMVTHSIDAALMADRVIALRDGRIIMDDRTPSREEIEDAVSQGTKTGTASFDGDVPVPPGSRGLAGEINNHGITPEPASPRPGSHPSRSGRMGGKSN